MWGFSALSMIIITSTKRLKLQLQHVTNFTNIKWNLIFHASINFKKAKIIMKVEENLQQQNNTTLKDFIQFILIIKHYTHLSCKSTISIFDLFSEYN